MITLADSSDFIATIAVGGSLIIGVIFALTDHHRKLAKIREREQSRREIAAYVAEGSMTPEQGASLLNAGVKNDDRSPVCAPAQS